VATPFFRKFYYLICILIAINIVCKIALLKIFAICGCLAHFLLFSSEIADQGGYSQNFLSKFVRFFVTLGLKILRLFRLKVLFEADIIKG
jgi:hypothetical protein